MGWRTRSKLNGVGGFGNWLGEPPEIDSSGREAESIGALGGNCGNGAWIFGAVVR